MQTPGWKPLPERAVTPHGWIRRQLRDDLLSGAVGHLDRIAPDLTVDDDIYGANRLGPTVTAKNLGALSDDDEWTVQFLWWNSETQSNWRDGWLRHCYLVGDDAHRQQAQEYVARICATQDADGYLGVYGPQLRFPREGENGELWALATLLRGLLGFYGHTGDPAVLQTVERAVRTTVDGYRGSNPFGTTASYAGTAHGLMLVDVLWELHLLTAEPGYLADALWLYESFSAAPVSETDAQADTLLGPDGFQGHGVHTYEHWRALSIAAIASPDQDRYAALLQAYATKLAAARTPSGAPNGDESCHPDGDPDTTGYEYCSIQELLHSYGLRACVQTAASFGDLMESLVYNVGFGARDPLAGGVAYLKTDNSFSMTGPEGFRPPEGPVPQTRYHYSQLHRQAAVCCVPNAGRLLPTYLRYRWLRGTRDGLDNLVCLFFEEGSMREHVAGGQVEIHQDVDYPTELSARFTISATPNDPWVLSLRNPSWASDAQWRTPHAITVTKDGDLVHFSGSWRPGDCVEVVFDAPPRIEAWRAQTMVAKGPLLYAQPLPGQRLTVHEYDLPEEGLRLRDVAVSGAYDVAPVVGNVDWQVGEPVAEAVQAPHSWQRQGLVHAGATLVPMGATVLRRLTLPA